MSSANDYSFLDRLLHRIAFSMPMLQVTMGDLENDIFKKRIAGADFSDEIFVTGLPRAGTTLVMSLLYATGEFGTFTYRQMPFILAPLLWDRISRPFQKKAEVKERAHGDGMDVSFDSPEAFEEVIWLAHFAKRFVAGDRLRPLGGDDFDNDFAEAICGTIRKCLILEQDGAPDARRLRYLSKNNANISRIPLLRKLFPSARILVPFRHPLAHISSLETQHERFLDQHGREAFARQYMRWLGHFEFGENFKPIDFDGWLRGAAVPDRIDHDFWIRYWTVAYAQVLQQKDDRVDFVDFEGLLRDGESVLGNIAGKVGLENPGTLVSGAASLRTPTTRPFDDSICSPANLEAAIALHEKLKSVAL